MADDQNCFRCGQSYASNQLTASPAGNRFCQACWSKINPRIETARKCPVDGAEMKKRLVAEAEEDVSKAIGGNKAAGTRVRKKMQEIKAAAQDVRKKILEGREAEPA